MTHPYRMNYDDTPPTALARINKAWNENPLLVIGVATGATMALARLIEAVGGVQSRRAYARRIGAKARTR